MELNHDIERHRVRQSRDQQLPDLHLPAEWMHTGERIDKFNQQEPKRV